MVQSYNVTEKIARLEAIAESVSLAIAFNRVPDVLRAYAHGILGHLLQYFETHLPFSCISLTVNHDHNNGFCVYIHISHKTVNGSYLILVEVGSDGVSIADNIDYYKACSIASERWAPFPERPLLFDYADSNLLENITTTIMSIGFLIRETNHIIDNHFPSVLENNR